MNIEEYLTILTGQIRCKKARQGVAQEIRNHILDQTQAYEQDGMEHEKAVELAVREMGNPVEAGTALDRIHRPQFDWRLFLITVLFSMAGVFIMAVTGALGQNAEWLNRQCLFTLLGIGITAVVYFVDYTFLGKYPLQIYVIMTLVFFLYERTGTRVNGVVVALRSLAYLYVPAYAGLLYKYRGKGVLNLVRSFGFLLLTALLSQWFSRSLYIGMGIGVICTLVFLYTALKGWFSLEKILFDRKRLTTPVLLAVIFIFVTLAFATYILCFAQDYQKIRFAAFLHPEEYMDANYQLMITRRAINGAQFIGESTQGTIIKPFVQQDTFLIFAQVVAMYGLAAGAVVITAFAVFALRALHVVKCQKNQLGMVLSAACFLLIFFNCVTGILMNFGLLPLGSLQFPFLSRGGSATVMYAVIIGLLMSCSRYTHIQTNPIEGIF